MITNEFDRIDYSHCDISLLDKNLLKDELLCLAISFIEKIEPIEADAFKSMIASLLSQIENIGIIFELDNLEFLLLLLVCFSSFFENTNEYFFNTDKSSELLEHDFLSELTNNSNPIYIEIIESARKIINALRNENIFSDNLTANELRIIQLFKVVKIFLNFGRASTDFVIINNEAYADISQLLNDDRFMISAMFKKVELFKEENDHQIVFSFTTEPFHEHLSHRGKRRNSKLRIKVPDWMRVNKQEFGIPWMFSAIFQYFKINKTQLLEGLNCWFSTSRHNSLTFVFRDDEAHLDYSVEITRQNFESEIDWLSNYMQVRSFPQILEETLPNAEIFETLKRNHIPLPAILEIKEKYETMFIEATISGKSRKLILYNTEIGAYPTIYIVIHPCLKMSQELIELILSPAEKTQDNELASFSNHTQLTKYLIRMCNYIKYLLFARKNSEPLIRGKIDNILKKFPDKDRRPNPEFDGD